MRTEESGEQNKNLTPSLRRTSECLRNLQEAEQTRIQQGKVADTAAAANLAGNGVMRS